MKQIFATTLMVCLCVTPALAEDESAQIDNGFSLMEEGAKMLMRGLMSEIEPAITGLRGSLEEIGPALGEFAAQMGPAFAELLNQVDDFRHYDAPEFLPNGDIIIRRKPDAPIWLPNEAPPQEIEL